MTDLSHELRATLATTFALTTPTVEHREKSVDGTEKFLLRLADGRNIESVFIPDTPSMTFCVSTQVGCAMACAFCLTGRMGLVRNLTAGEIVGQVRVLASALEMRDTRFNIVLMGMGEPLHNYDETMKALRILADEQGFAMSPRRITLSTVGILPALEKLAREPVMPNLAISLHAPTDLQRGELVPINKKYGVADIVAACKRFPLKRRSRITFEYVPAGRGQRPSGRRAEAREAAGRRTVEGEPDSAQRGRGDSVQPAVRRSDRSVRQNSGRSRADRLGSKEPRPRYPRRLRSVDRRRSAQVTRSTPRRRDVTRPAPAPTGCEGGLAESAV